MQIPTQLLIMFLIAVAGVSAQARPVSYAGGVTLSTFNDSNAYALLTHYSPSAEYAIGHRVEYRRDANLTLNALQTNILLNRINARDSQANIYVKGGLGTVYSDNGAFQNEVRGAAFIGMAADWENRRYFTSYENRLLYAGDIDNAFMQRARVGVAPYIGDYGDLHTWLMLEVQHFPRREQPVRVAPLVRLFKGLALAEAGIDNQGDILFNFTYRF